MSRTLFSFRRPQLEALEDRLAPGSLLGTAESPDLGLLAGIYAAQQAARTDQPVDVVAVANAGDVNAGTVVGTSTITRTDNGIIAHLTATGLPPGAYTFWMKVDAPGLGPVSGRLAGHVVGQSGNLEFSAHVSTGEVLGAGNDVNPDFPSGPLTDPQHATITLVVRYHGPANPGQIYEQSHTHQPGVAFNFLKSVHAP